MTVGITKPTSSTPPARKARPVGNFYGPFFSVKFYPPVVEPKTLSINIPFGEPIIISFEDVSKQQTINAAKNLAPKYAANLSVQFHPGVALMTLTLTPTYDDAIQLLKSGLFQYGGVVGVKWGYASENLVTDEYPFIINQPKVQFGRETIITISGVDAFSYITKLQRQTEMYPRATYASDYDVLGQIALNLNYQLVVDASSAAALKKPDHPANITKSSPVPEASSDWDLFKILCRADGLVWHYSTSDKSCILTIYDRRFITKSNVDYNFYWYGSPGSDRDIPMMNFTTNPLPTIFAPKSLRNSFTTTHDPDTGQIKYETLDTSSDSNTSHMGDSKVDRTVAGTDNLHGQVITMSNGKTIIIPSYNVKLSDGTIAQARVGQHAPCANNSASRDIINNNTRDAALIANTTATLTAPGHPDVIPPMVVNIRGVGGEELFDGDYYIISTKHNVGTGVGYEMSLELLRTTTARTGNAVPNAKEAPGTQEEPPPPNPRTSDDTHVAGPGVKAAPTSLVPGP